MLNELANDRGGSSGGGPDRSARPPADRPSTGSTRMGRRDPYRPLVESVEDRVLMAVQVLPSAGPINAIIVGDDGSFQVQNTAFPISSQQPFNGQIFPSTNTTQPANGGVFVRLQDGTVYGLNLDATPGRGAASRTRSLGLNPVSNQLGSDRQSITTVADNNLSSRPDAPPFQLTQVVSYNPGNDFFRVDTALRNTGSAALTVDLFAAADLYLAFNDFGVGFYNPSTGGVGGTDATGTYNIFIEPNSGAGLPPSHFQEADYRVIFSTIGNNQDFNDTVLLPTTSPPYDGSGGNPPDPNYIDNGAGLQWQDVTVQPNGVATISYYWAFGDIPSVVPQANFTVTNTNDSGAGSLRQAIVNSESVPGANTIDFAIPGPGPYTIALASALPAINDQVTIDATTQPGYAGTPLVFLNGANAVLAPNTPVVTDGSLLQGANGLTFTSTGNTVRGLAIGGFSGVGIYLSTPPSSLPLVSSGITTAQVASGGDVIQGNYLGTDTTGRVAVGNALGGIFIETNGNLIGGDAVGEGNLISGNGSAGVTLAGLGAYSNEVVGNRIGTDVTGTAALGNVNIGVLIRDGASFNIIGGSQPGFGNLISGNSFGGTSASPTDDPATTGAGGVVILGPTSICNYILGNRIGTDISGAAALGNDFDGIAIAGARDNRIGGSAPGEGNLIAGNSAVGVRISGAGASGNLVAGNTIGAGPGLGNAYDGVYLNGAPGNTIGGPDAGASNTIANNGGSGVQIQGATATGDLVQGNVIASNQLDGVFLNNAPGNAILDNQVSSNGFSGVELQGAGTTNNVVQGNFIGTDPSGTQQLGNSAYGILIGGATNNTIGGDAAGAANVVAYNGFNGIQVFRNGLPARAGDDGGNTIGTNQESGNGNRMLATINPPADTGIDAMIAQASHRRRSASRTRASAGSSPYRLIGVAHPMPHAFRTPRAPRFHRALLS